MSNTPIAPHIAGKAAVALCESMLESLGEAAAGHTDRADVGRQEGLRQEAAALIVAIILGINAVFGH